VVKIKRGGRVTPLADTLLYIIEAVEREYQRRPTRLHLLGVDGTRSALMPSLKFAIIPLSASLVDRK
jgi:hypothetical protein